MDPRRSLPHALLRSYLGLRRFPFAGVAEAELESQEEMKARGQIVV